MAKRSRFDPQLALGAPELKQDATLTVTQLAARIDAALSTGLPGALRVVGELSNVKRQTHLYFNLRDPDGADESKAGAVISGVMFATAVARLGFPPADGLRVVVTGRISFFAKQGRTQLYAEAMEPVGAGALELKLRALMLELRELGWFAPERKRPLPVFPRRVAIITSRGGAALQDVLNTMNRRCPAVQPVLIDVRVQGDEAAPSIVRALRYISRDHKKHGIDAVILTRGGGSIEDLWAFNDRAAAEAVLRCAVPVVAAIGHETDTTIAELVADARAATPTQAAMLLTPDRAALLEELAHRGAALAAHARRRLEREALQLRVLARDPLFADPADRLVRERADLAQRGRRLIAAARATFVEGRLRQERAARRLERCRPVALMERRRAHIGQLDESLSRSWRLLADRQRSYIAALDRELTLTGPASVLNRGYSVTTDDAGQLIRSAANAAAGSRLRTRVVDGVIHSHVVDPEAPASLDVPPVPIPPAPARPARGRRGRPLDRGPGLFDAG